MLNKADEHQDIREAVAGCAGSLWGGPSPCPGLAGCVSFTLRVNDARLTNRPRLRALRCAPFAAHPPDRHPGHPQRRCRAAECIEP